MTRNNEVKTSPTDLAGPDFWNALWRSRSGPTREIGNPRLRHWEIQHVEFFRRAFATIGPTQGKEILEIGAGDSGWLAYFAKYFGLRVSGLDYSPVGCERASNLLRRAGVAGTIVLADMFAPPPELIGKFDIVLSMGVAEHYKDTGQTLQAMAAFVRPGGILVTTVPNIPGLVGNLFKILNRPVYDIHEPVGTSRLRAGYETAGLELIASGHFMSLNLGVVNTTGLPPGILTTLRQGIVLTLIAASRAVWWVEERLARLPVTSYMSPYVYAIGRKLPEAANAQIGSSQDAASGVP